MPVLYFDEIVPEKSILRELPAALEPTMRMRIDALVYSADAISHNWHRLKATAYLIEEHVERLDYRKRAAMLSAAWSIVDELDAVRQLVRALITPERQPGPFTKSLLDACEPIRDLRNNMRHLAGNLRKIANSKGRRSPLLGALSWFWCPEYQQGKGYILTIQTGMIYGGERMQPINPCGMEVSPPADLFHLDAFGIALNLNDPVRAFSEWIEASTDDWAAQIDAQIKAHSAATGTDEATLRSHMGGGLTVSMAVKFDPAGLALTGEQPDR